MADKIHPTVPSPPQAEIIFLHHSMVLGAREILMKKLENYTFREIHILTFSKQLHLKHYSHSNSILFQ